MGRFEKEKLIYEAVFDLAKSGKDLKDLRVQDIADAANIGKGTLYEYFKSKEEIYNKTIFYFMIQELELFRAILQSQTDFRMKIEKCLEKIVEKQQDCYSSFQVLFTNNQGIRFDAILNEGKKEFQKLIPMYIELIDQLIQCGMDQGVIGTKMDRQYQRFVFFGAISAFNIDRNLVYHSYEQLDYNQSINYAVELIIKALRD